MDASAYLKSRGWRGKGHALHADKGLATPLLISRNTDGRGVGHTANDQWWLHAFDQKLKGLDVSKKGVVIQTVTSGKLDSISTAKGKYSGLYASFVSGGLMEGTLTPEAVDESTDATPASEDRDAVPGLKKGVKMETREEKRLRRAAKSARKAERTVRRAARAERRASRAERRSARAEQRQAVETTTKRRSKEATRLAEEKRVRRAMRAEKRVMREAMEKIRAERASRPEG